MLHTFQGHRLIYFGEKIRGFTIHGHAAILVCGQQFLSDSDNDLDF